MGFGDMAMMGLSMVPGVGALVSGYQAFQTMQAVGDLPQTMDANMDKHMAGVNQTMDGFNQQMDQIYGQMDAYNQGPYGQQGMPQLGGGQQPGGSTQPGGSEPRYVLI
jgi:hypothetical protein